MIVSAEIRWFYMRARKDGDKHNLEVKALRSGTETLQLPNDVTGRTECWVKWSYGEAPVAPLVQAILAQANGNIDLQKKRWLRKFSLDGGYPEPVPAEQRPTAGCTVELTQLHVQERPFWTLALETFGAEQQVRAHLWAVATEFFTHHPPLAICTTVNSCSYPVWLANL